MLEKNDKFNIIPTPRAVVESNLKKDFTEKVLGELQNGGDDITQVVLQFEISNPNIDAIRDLANFLRDKDPGKALDNLLENNEFMITLISDLQKQFNQSK